MATNLVGAGIETTLGKALESTRSQRRKRATTMVDSELASRNPCIGRRVTAASGQEGSSMFGCRAIGRCRTFR